MKTRTIFYELVLYDSLKLQKCKCKFLFYSQKEFGLKNMAVFLLLMRYVELSSWQDCSSPDIRVIPGRCTRLVRGSIERNCIKKLDKQC